MTLALPPVLRDGTPHNAALYEYGAALGSALGAGTAHADVAPEPGVQALIGRDKAVAIARHVVRTLVLKARLEWWAGRNTILPVGSADAESQLATMLAWVKRYVPATLNNHDDPAACVWNFDETKAELAAQLQQGGVARVASSDSPTGWCATEWSIGLPSLTVGTGRSGCRLTPGCRRTDQGALVPAPAPSKSLDTGTRTWRGPAKPATPKAPASPPYSAPTAPAPGRWWAWPATLGVVAVTAWGAWRLTRRRRPG